MNVKYGSRKKQSLRQKKRVPLFCFNNVLVGSDDEKLESLSLRLREEALSAKGKFVVKVAEKVRIFCDISDSVSVNLFTQMMFYV